MPKALKLKIYLYRFIKNNLISHKPFYKHTCIYVSQHKVKNIIWTIRLGKTIKISNDQNDIVRAKIKLFDHKMFRQIKKKKK